MQRIVLSIILLVYILTGALYAVRTPKWQAPDEPAHFNYIRTIGETGTLPILQQGDYNQDYLEQIKAAKFPPGMTVDNIRYESYSPPLYYLAATPVFLAASMGGIDAQVLALRMFSVLLEVLVLLLAYRIVSEIFPGDRVLPLAAVGLLATIPMHVAITASIGSDAAGELVVALILFLAVRRIKGEVTDRRFVIIGGILFGAALLTKTTAYLTGAVVLVVTELAFTRWGDKFSRRWLPDAATVSTDGDKSLRGLVLLEAISPVATRSPTAEEDCFAKPARNDLAVRLDDTPVPPPSLSPSRVLVRGGEDEGSMSSTALVSGAAYVRQMVALFAISLVIASPMFVRNMITYGMGDPLGLARHDAVVAGQPTTAQIIAQYGWRRVLTDGVTVTFRSFWGQFGWMGVLMNDRVYLLLLALTVVAVAGLGLYVIRVFRRRDLLDWTQWWSILLCAVLILAGLAAYIGYNFKFYQLQGRYLFPAIIPIALFLVIGARELLPRAYAHWILALLYLAMVGLDIAALFLYIIPQLRMAS